MTLRFLLIRKKIARSYYFKNVVILISFVIRDDSKFYPQEFLEEAFLVA